MFSEPVRRISAKIVPLTTDSVLNLGIEGFIIHFRKGNNAFGDCIPEESVKGFVIIGGTLLLSSVPGDL